jgi:hypothetical protein
MGKGGRKPLCKSRERLLFPDEFTISLGDPLVLLASWKSDIQDKVVRNDQEWYSLFPAQ